MSDKDKEKVVPAKGAVIEKIPNGTLVRIRWEGGGEVPAELSGAYTSVVVAKRHLERYLLSRADGREVSVKVQAEEEEKARQEKAKSLNK